MLKTESLIALEGSAYYNTVHVVMIVQAYRVLRYL